MKLTKKQRAQVVELLRCAADNHDPLDTFGFCVTSYRLGRSPARLLAADALVETVGERGNDWRAACLEAAQLVEEGSWP